MSPFPTRLAAFSGTEVNIAKRPAMFGTGKQERESLARSLMMPIRCGDGMSGRVVRIEVTVRPAVP
ncbi:MAG: hypothetical protein ABSD75_00545 [Terriglobales bacterium]